VPSVLASLGTPGFENTLALPPTCAACVLLVDGLGAELVRAHPLEAPLLYAALTGPAGRDLTAGFPSTTAASIGSIGTGLPPGSHGILGYQVRVPGTDRLLNSLRWDAPVDPLEWQPCPTAFERAVAAGTAVVEVAKRAFEDGGLTKAVLRGARFVGADSFGEVGGGALEALDAVLADDAPAGRGRGLVYAYVADLDGTGHARGVDSQAWRFQLQLVDRLVEQICEKLPAGTRLYVTADHGMVDVPAGSRIDMDVETDLRDGVDLVGGEARARYLYVRDGALDDVLATWRHRLGAGACVCTRDEAIDAGWFGPVADWARERIGDVVVASLSDLAVVASKREVGESRLIGHHGSLTPAEQLVPLAAFDGG
jgi:hypothetical protein